MTLRYGMQLPVQSQSKLYAEPWEYRTNIDHDMAVFAQDRWMLGRLTINYGVRLDGGGTLVVVGHAATRGAVGLLQDILGGNKPAPQQQPQPGSTTQPSQPPPQKKDPFGGLLDQRGRPAGASSGTS